MFTNIRELIQSIPVEIQIVLCLLISFAVTITIIPTIIRVAHLKKLYSIHNDDRSNLPFTPTLGGIAILSGFLISITIINTGSEIVLQYLIPCLLIIFFIGLKDDILILAPKWKLLAQITSAAIMILFSKSMVNLLPGDGNTTYIINFLVTILVYILITNGFNLVDGIDGLAAGIGIIVTVSFGILFYLEQQFFYVLLSSSLAGSLISFLRFNLFNKKKRLYMGDSGSLIVGFIISVLAIKLLQLDGIKINNGTTLNIHVIVPGILIIPLFDTLSVSIIRLIKKKSPFIADRNHIHYRLVDSGLSHKQATGILCLANLLFIAITLLISFLAN